MSSAATTAHAEAVRTTAPGPALGIAWTRYGVAFPTVSAPTTVPIARPRLERNQVAAIFIAGGYTPASAIPVANRSASAVEKPSLATTPALTVAPSTAAVAK